MLCHHYSSWCRLKRGLAWIMKTIQKLSGQDTNHTLSADDIRESEVRILVHVQAHHYKAEIHRLKRGNNLQHNSSIRKLSPIIDEYEVLCVQGRLQNSSLEICSKEPRIIPQSHPIAKLIALDMHNIAHLGQEWTLSLIRKRYWITKARVVIKKITRNCMTCKRLFSQPTPQKMASLPAERIEHDKPPFFYIGIDCFCPFYVKQRRSEIKRYGCIFTCLTTRAVHIEMLYNLEADTFINGLRRFISRTPCKIWSDNGTNFTAADAEMSKNIQSIYKEVIQKYAVRCNIEWNFNPPSASHMGGVWERMIRTIRKVFTGLLVRNARLTDDIMTTLFGEV